MSELQQPAYRTLRHRDFRRLGAATLVSTEDVPGGLTMNITFLHIAMILGPSIAGIIIGAAGGPGSHTTRGLAPIYFANAGSFLTVLAALATLHASGKPVRSSRGEES